MGLLTDTLLKATTDKLARIFGEFAFFVSPSNDPELFTGTLLQASANQLLRLTVEDSNDFNVEADLNADFKKVGDSMNANGIMAGLFTSALTALNNHYAAQSEDGNLAGYLLTTNNPTGSLNTYTTLVDPFFQDFSTFTQGAALDAESVMPKVIHPNWRGTEYTDAKAMGNRAVGGAFADGYAANAAYGSVIPRVEVTADFSGGATPVVITLDGTDGEGNAVVWTATVTGGNNPTSAVATTITPAVSTAAARLTVVVASLSGIVAGSVLKVNAGLTDEETILVESIDAGAVTITAVFLRNHTAGAALSGNRTFVTTPGTATSRLRDLSGITITVGTHAAGTVRVTGVPDRIAI